MRRHELLFEDASMQIFRIYWPPGHGIDWHDHGDSDACVMVVSGSLHEERDHQYTVHINGDVFGIAPHTLHRVVNLSGSPAVSVHVYRPPLTQTYPPELEITP